MEQKDKLYCISSDASATSAIERNVILAEAFGADVDSILYGTGVRGYARSSFKSIPRSSHCERTRN
jgi:hypothetical protein